jgi:hypothetical protein
MLRTLASATVILGLLGAPAFADDEIIRDRITLPAGSTAATVKGSITGYASYEYLVSANAGQTMTVKLEARNKSTYFNVWPPGKKPGLDEAMFIGDISGDVFSQKITESGDYLVQVYLYRNAARRNESSDFTVRVDLTDGGAATEPQPDFADGLMGGPDFWEVAGLATGKTINLRREAARSSAIVGRLRSGTILRNKGCKMNGAQRWCNVERSDNPEVSGWVAGQFLREAAVGAGGASPDDALVPGTNFHATGRIPCTLDGQLDVTDCEFGVTRGAPGIATVFITVPNGFVRVLSFDNGKVSPQSEVTSFESSREGENTRVKVNGMDENYLIPDAVILGG